MKYLLALIVGIVGTALYLKTEETTEQKINRQASLFCSCHKGVDVFYYVKDDFIGFLEVQCKDGTSVESKGKTDEIELGGGDGCQD